MGAMGIREVRCLRGDVGQFDRLKEIKPPKNWRLRAYPNNPLYCVRLQSPMPALSAKNVLNAVRDFFRWVSNGVNVEQTTPGEARLPAARPFWPAALASPQDT